MAAGVRRVSYSANEVMVMAAKAARGVGAPPEQASLFGRATLCHLSAGRDPREIEAAVRALPKGPILSLPPYFMALQEAAAGGEGHGELPPDVPIPLVCSYADAQGCQTSYDAAVGLILTDLSQPAAPLPAPRLDPPAALVALLQELGARILVPESEASRLGGAGAGLTDND